MVKLVNRAKMTTTTTGTGTITLGSAVGGFQSFAAAGVADADVVRYVIEDGTAWEIGTGTYTASGTTMTRTVIESSNADAAINLTGSAVVYVSATADDIQTAYTDADVDTHLNTMTASSGEVLSWTGTDYDWIAAGGGAALQLYVENPSTFTAPSAGSTPNNSVAIGNNARAFNEESIAIGLNSRVQGGSGSVAIGYNATATTSSSIALGFSAYTATGSRSTALTNSYAAGTDSFAAAIANNTSSYGATGANSVAIGEQAKASVAQGIAIGDRATVGTGGQALALGQLATASGTSSIGITGYSCLASGTAAIAIGSNYYFGLPTASGVGSVVIGDGSTASAQYSMVWGHGGTATIIGKQTHATGRFAASGDSQEGRFIMRSDTTDATPEALTTNNNTASTTNQIILPNNSAYAFHGTIVARQQASAGTDCAAWKIEGLIRREGTAGTTVLVNSATTVLDNTPAWGMALSADTTNGGLKIEVTGAAATNIRWVATINTSEVTY